jgi:hypothetical protein
MIPGTSLLPRHRAGVMLALLRLDPRLVGGLIEREPGNTTRAF